MKFHVRKEELKSKLDIIRKSRSMTKSVSDDMGSILLIKANAEEKSLKFYSSNFYIWSSSSIIVTDINDTEIFDVELSGEIHLNGPNFIDFISTFPDESIITFEIEESNDNTSLSAKCKKIKGTKKVNFFKIEANDFDPNPPVEDRKSFVISCEKLLKAVESVEYASDVNENRQHLFGILTEFYPTTGNIACCATDTIRIVSYDELGIEKVSEEPIVLSPIKASFINAIKTMNNKEDVTIEVGETQTILRQKNQWHSVPNVNKSLNDEFPNWREIFKKYSEEVKTSFFINKNSVSECLRSAKLASHTKYGVRASFNCSEKTIKFAADNIDDGSIVKSLYEEVETIEDIQGEETDYSILFIVDILTEIVSNLPGNTIIFDIINESKALLIRCEDPAIRIIISTIQ